MANNNYYLSIIRKKLILSAILPFLFIFFVLAKPTHAQILFSDEFNGNAELSSYNNNYELLTDFHENTGIFNVVSDHVEATGYDPGYVYSAIPANNVCASIEFNWSGGLSTGNWTNIILHSTPNNFASAFQVRDDNGTQQRWVYYDGTGSIYIDGALSFDETQNHIVKACVTGTIITGYLDDTLLFTHENTVYSGGYMGFASQITTMYLDNFKIESSSTDPVPLAVPVFKQTNPGWNSQVYDTANVWNPIDPTINAWGCALTSAAMVLKFHGINKMLDGVTDLDPGTLNTWLNSQEDGYVGNGLVNWLAISRFSKLARGINGVLSYDALEYNRVEGADTAQLGEDLNNNIPGILEEPGHFVVAKGITQTSFSINDPFYDNRPTLASYSGTFLSLGRFVPSLTDLSYIMIVLDTNIQGALTTVSGSAVGTSFIQNPIINPLNPSSSSSPAKRIIYLPKPDTGLYDLILSSNTNTTYSAKIFLYDENGNVILSTSSGILGNSTTDTITIDFKKSGNTSSDTERIVTFQSVIDDIIDLRSNGDIKKDKLKNDLIKLMQKAEGIVNAAKFKKNELKQKFNDFEKNLKKNRGKDMTEDAYQILLYDLQFLRNLYL